jgi:hypothetical protein
MADCLRATDEKAHQHRLEPFAVGQTYPEDKAGEPPCRLFRSVIKEMDPWVTGEETRQLWRKFVCKCFERYIWIAPELIRTVDYDNWRELEVVCPALFQNHPHQIALRKIVQNKK